MHFRSGDAYTYDQFMKDLNAEKISRIDIYQNEEPPTGKIVVVVDNAKKSYYETDVNSIAVMLKEEGRAFISHDVEKPSWFLTTIVPLLLGFIIIMVLFSFLTNQMSGGGGNSKVMNFGKSRAKLSTDENKRTTFKKVAGLEEEKDRKSVV